MNKEDILKGLDYLYNEYTKCPYCNYEDVDCFELSDNEGITECPNCGREYEYVRNIEVNYSTYKVER